MIYLLTLANLIVQYLSLTNSTSYTSILFLTNHLSVLVRAYFQYTKNVSCHQKYVFPPPRRCHCRAAQRKLNIPPPWDVYLDNLCCRGPKSNHY